MGQEDADCTAVEEAKGHCRGEVEAEEIRDLAGVDDVVGGGNEGVGAAPRGDSVAVEDPGEAAEAWSRRTGVGTEDGGDAKGGGAAVEDEARGREEGEGAPRGQGGGRGATTRWRGRAARWRG